MRSGVWTQTENILAHTFKEQQTQKKDKVLFIAMTKKVKNKFSANLNAVTLHLMNFKKNYNCGICKILDTPLVVKSLSLGFNWPKILIKNNNSRV